MFDIQDYRKFVLKLHNGKQAVYKQQNITEQLLEAVMQVDKSTDAYLTDIPSPRISEKLRIILDIDWQKKPRSVRVNTWLLYLYNFKKCGRCCKILAISAFGQSTATWSTLHPYCRLCANNSSYIWNEHNKEKRKEIVKTWQQANRESCRKATEKHRKNNLDKDAAKTAKRRASKLQATPMWLSKQQLAVIEGYYKEAKKLSQQTGIAYEVDHIVPLQGENIRGLHVPWNLQVIPAKDNRIKSNKYDGP